MITRTVRWAISSPNRQGVQYQKTFSRVASKYNVDRWISAMCACGDAMLDSERGFLT
jgi:hypothetical protein